MSKETAIDPHIVDCLEMIIHNAKIAYNSADEILNKSTDMFIRNRAENIKVKAWDTLKMETALRKLIQDNHE